MSATRMQSCFAAWMLTLVVVFYALPAYNMYSWALIGISASLAVLAGVKAHRPSRRLPWYLLSAVLASFTLGDTTYNVLTDFLGAVNPFPSLADVFYLLMYPLLGVALLIFIRARSGADNRAALIDALVPSAGLGLLSWVFLISPYVRDTGLTVPEKLTSVAYPLGDVLALAMLLRLLTSGGKRPAALSALLGGVTSLLVTDVLYGLRQLDGSWHVGGPVDCGWVIFYTAVALAATHPSMRDLTARQRVTPAVPGGRRIAAMAAAALIAPAVLAVEDVRGRITDGPMIAGASAVMFSLVMIRVADLVRQQRETAARERTLRLAGADLVTATTEGHVGAALDKAVAELVPAGEPYVLHFHGVDGPPDLHTGTPTTTLGPVAAMAAAESLGGFENALLAEVITAGRMPGGLTRHKQVYLAAGDDLLARMEPVLEALMAQATLAIERIALTTEINRRSSEDYFRALIQSAADVILIVGDDDLIQYASPSAVEVFGRTQIVGLNVKVLIAATDHGDLRHLLGQVRGGRGTRDGVDLTAISGEDLLLQVECSARDLRDDPAVNGLVVTIRDVTERRRLESELSHQAFHDGLTGLANRALFQNRLEQAAVVAESIRAAVGVLFVDIDDFKEVNETLGHSAGDALLVAAGRRIGQIAGPLNTSARTGGDEYAVLVEHVTSPDDVDGIAARIVEAFAEPFELVDAKGHAHLVKASASVGVATSAETAGITELLRRADVAMYGAKTSGKNTWQRYRDEMHVAMLQRLELRAALPDAVPGGQLRLRYQPIVDLPTGDISGFEALVRWQHPQRGLLGPIEFIELAEENGSVVAIGNWVLREALNEFAGWRRDNPQSGLRYVSVNVSARQFRTPGFVEQVLDALAETGAKPEWLLLEITESLVLHDAEQVNKDLNRLRDHGVRIAIDDFGTGYSSLSYLSQMPVDVLKIDKSFIDDILHNGQQLALVETIISLARTLNLQVVAEGIELGAHRAALVDAGCPYGQGYLFSKPVPPDEVGQWLDSPFTAFHP